MYRALAPRLADLAVVAGTSIGAVNAGLIARHYATPDRGARALEKFWTGALQNPSWLFFPPVGVWQRWNAVWTSLLLGHPHLFTPPRTPRVPWVLRPPVWWFETHFYDLRALEETLEDPRVFGSYGHGATAPRLIVTAVDVEEGRPRAFDSRDTRITPAHLLASGSLPPSFPARAVAGKRYWDGGLWSNTPLGPVLNTLQNTDTAEESYDVYIVDVFPPRRPVPETSGGVFQRMVEIIYADKTGDDVRASAWVNAYVDLLRALKEEEDQLPEGVRRRIQLEERYRRAIVEQKRVHLNLITIRRTSPSDEQGDEISSGIDFSRRRIEELLAQGYQDARRELATSDARASSPP